MSKRGPFGSIQSQPPMPPAVVADRFMRMIEVGHTVLYKDLVFEVADVRPMMNPSGPAMMQIELRMDNFRLANPRGGRAPELIILGESEARVKARAAMNGGSGTEEPSKLVLTDAPVPQTPQEATEEAEVAEAAADAVGPTLKCSSCGDTASVLEKVGDLCTDCGVGTYREA